mmetsp:Transcript_67354/g.111563  ORF Transcript_67354/g.111563 Transcript_67354/m.111563 type:complete len:316 (-) Transcript_67354:284-1231(-)
MAERAPRMECPHCGYHSHPQWMNDEAHCLKCDAVLLTRASCHGEARPVPGTHRAPGEVSTHKYSPSDAMESESGVCKSSPTGMHQWRFGKCAYCRMPEGQLAKGAGTMQDPGAHGGGCPKGGKCMFKFAKCTKCGRGEGGVTAPPAARSGRRAGDKIKEIFQKFDTDGNGVISLAELKSVLQRLPVPSGSTPMSDSVFDTFLAAMDENHDGVVDYNEFADWLDHDDSGTAAAIMGGMRSTAASRGGSRPASRQPKAAPKAAPKAPSAPAPKSAPRGPERFFYDKSSYTGTHARGGPESVAVGHGTAYDQSWKRPG